MAAWCPDIEDLGAFCQDILGRKVYIFDSKVLISGMNNLGAEIAKNLILSGVKSVFLHDDCLVESGDLSGSFIFTEEHMGQNRASSSVERLQELNNAVEVSALGTELRDYQLSAFQVVVFTDIALEKAIELNEYCHNHKPSIAFIKAEVRGLFGRVFCDFGPKISVYDPMLSVSDGRTQAQKVKLLNRCKPLKETLANPGDVSPLLHLAFLALDEFITSHGRLPVPGSEEDADIVISSVKRLNEDLLGDKKIEDIQLKILQQFAFGASAVLSPMASLFGGIVGQEVVKACSKKFYPIGLFYFESVGSLSSEPVEASDFSHHDAQISVFGSKLQKRLEDAKVFVVGSGALGCEFLKNLALMGVSCGKGKLTIADHDVVHRGDIGSNLLFRGANIGQLKATVAVASISATREQQLNNIEAIPIRVEEQTENVFNASFWEKYDVVIDALDKNDDARLYVDQRCLYFRKAFLVSETLGPHCCTTHVVIPDLTESYSSISTSTVHNITPSIATTSSATSSPTSSAMAAGYVCLELYKVLGGGHTLEDYRNVDVILGVPTVSVPELAKVTAHGELKWTIWDRWVINGNPTIEELFAWLSAKGLKALSLSCENKMIHVFHTECDAKNLKKTVLELVRDMVMLEIPEHCRHVDVKAVCVDIDNIDMNIDIPLVSVVFGEPKEAAGSVVSHLTS